jgi:GNAT superfamily N-acetyltransferase
LTGGAVDRAAAARLFAGRDELPAVLGAGLAGLGRLASDDPERPAVVRVSIGCYEIFGGDPAAAGAAALVRSARRPSELVYGADPAWRRLIRETHADSVADRPMRGFDPSGLDGTSLDTASRRLPSGFELLRIDARLARQLDAGLEPHALQVYPSAEAFAADGIGFGAVAQGRLACAATSYAACPGHLEVAIATRSDFRGRGLAMATTARLLAHCLAAGVRPHWNASNPVSQRLAVRLGFREGEVCEILYLS